MSGLTRLARLFSPGTNVSTMDVNQMVDYLVGRAKTKPPAKPKAEE